MNLKYFMNYIQNLNSLKELLFIVE